MGGRGRSGLSHIEVGDGASRDALKASPSVLTRGEDVEILECDKSGNVQQRWLYRHSTDGPILISSSDQPTSTYLSLFRGWRKVLFDAFLPVGFPHSVSEDYLAYQFYDSLQAFFSTITSLLASRALLQGLGVGDANSSATYAMLLTILRDAVSRIATIGFAQQFGLQIEPDAKRYRFLADLFNDTAFFLELFSPLLSSWVKIVVLCIAEALRALCGVAAGASKAALSMHFAKHDNLAELNAKEASQETAVGLIGLLVGTVVVKFVEGHRSVLVLVSLLVFGHLCVNYLGVRSVHMTTLNRQRATILFREYLHTGKVLSPKEVAARESILFWWPSAVTRGGRKMGRIDFPGSYAGALGSPNKQQRPSIWDSDKFSLFLSTGAQGDLTALNILLWQGSGPKNAITAWFAAIDIAYHWDKDPDVQENVERAMSDLSDKSQSYRIWELMGERGWNLEAQAFETGAPVRVEYRTFSRKDQ